mmetsp:Transcript_137382/g.342662  ORF Transcript_137382/g.342662 Transcript_137382/m.342662 type:complete len:96 (+) Transcript_137382:1292-1579(+)
MVCAWKAAGADVRMVGQVLIAPTSCRALATQANAVAMAPAQKAASAIVCWDSLVQIVGRPQHCFSIVALVIAVATEYVREGLADAATAGMGSRAP